MSYINFFIIKDDKVYFITTHFRKAKSLINNPESILPLLKSSYLDSGYVVLDFNSKKILDSQSAINLSHNFEKVS